MRISELQELQAAKKPRVEHEAEEQVKLMRLCQMNGRMYPDRYPGLEMMFHVPNGGKRSASEAARFRAEGVQAGIPDLCLPVPRGIYHGLWIELKRRDGGTVSALQKEWINKLRKQGYAAEVAHGCDEAWEYITEYYELGEFRQKT